VLDLIFFNTYINNEYPSVNWSNANYCPSRNEGFFQDQVEDSGLEHNHREIGSAFHRLGTEIWQKGHLWWILTNMTQRFILIKESL
jgi:hypothetical protein